MKMVGHSVTSSSGTPRQRATVAAAPTCVIPGSDFHPAGVARLISLLDAITQTIGSSPLPGPREHPGAILSPMKMTASLPERAVPCLLVVEDDTFSFDLIEDTFSSDHEVLWASDGETALQIAAEKVPDLILLDVMMPTMDGYEVCTRLKMNEATRAIPIIFITGRDDEDAETRGLEMGAVDYIHKPIHPAAVRLRVENQIKLKWAMERLTQVAALERTLREDALEELEIKTRDYPVQ